ncbi:MAG: hypothetical protein ABSG96_21690 [Terracidiphilus sp.]|jgi:hypothetical protein
MLKPYKIPTVLLVAAVALLAVGEIATGTEPLFAAFVAGTLICIGITYNILGGVSSISGIAFAGFSASSIVISQFAKVILMEPANRPLESPELTIKVYFLFYFCLMVGSSVYCRLRVRVPRPLEPNTEPQANLQYTISVTIGLLAGLLYEVHETSSNPSERASASHSIGLAFSPLLLFSIVLAVQSRIRSTHGRHSFATKAFIPWAASVCFGFIETSRGHMIISTVVYFFTCYASGYKFRRKHLLAAVIGTAAFAFVISPFEIYVRGPMRQLDFRGRIYEGYDLIRSLPDWSIVTQASSAGVESASREDYYQRPGTFVLSRLSAIRADSNMIYACSSGFHYGFTALKIDVLHNLPRFIYKNKPETDGAAYTGRVTGVNGDEVENGEFLITAIGDSYGAFGFFGVMVVGLLVFPTVFILYESMFDIRRPWGMVAAGAFCFQFAEVNMGGLLGLTLRAPIAILMLSYVMGGIVRMIPVKGDQGVILGPELAQ